MSQAAGRRRALVLACGTYADHTLNPLHSPARDAAEMRRVLSGGSGSRYEVVTSVDATNQQVRVAIAGFFDEARRTDAMNLLYFSCHGVLDRRNKLHFAFADSMTALLGATAVPADWVREVIDESRSAATVVLLDCCYSGMFVTAGHGALIISEVPALRPPPASAWVPPASAWVPPAPTRMSPPAPGPARAPGPAASTRAPRASRPAPRRQWPPAAGLVTAVALLVVGIFVQVPVFYTAGLVLSVGSLVWGLVVWLRR